MEQTFETVEWAMDTNIYEVNLRQYTTEGTFNAFAKELPRLKDMGIEVLWFMPITPISNKKRLGTLGSYYACSDYTATNPEFGTLEDFKMLVTQAHALGLKVIIDWVANHTGWDHRWTIEHPEFYRLDLNGSFHDTHGWDDVIDLNYDNPDLHTAMIDCMQFWITTCNIDGFRCDMAMLVPIEFWRSARTVLDQQKKLFWLAECEESSYHAVFDATYTWKWLHQMEAFYKHKAAIENLSETLHFYESTFPPNALRVFFTTNHDENSHSGSEFERLGNAAMSFAVFCCTWSGIPLIYSGQELPNKKRLKFFDKDEIEWNGTFALHDFFKKLLHLRKENPALRADAEVQIISTDADRFVMAYLRKYGNYEVLVLLNLSEADKPLVTIRDKNITGHFINLFSNNARDFTAEKYFSLRPWEYQVYVKM